MLKPLQYLFEQTVKSGDLVVVDGTGRQCRFGDGSGAEVVVAFRDRSAELALLRDPALVLGELYMDGRLEVLSGTIYDFLAIIMKGTARGPQHWILRVYDAIRYAARRVQQFI